MRIKRFLAAAGLLAGFTRYAAAQDAPPKGATGLCKDSTYAISAIRQGSCAKHGGLIK